jgi:hypothetical protein
MSNIFKIYAAHGDSGFDRGGLGPIIGFFSSRIDAEKFAKGKGYYGSNGTVRERFAIIQDDQVYLLDREDPIDLDRKKELKTEELKNQALSKLTEEERKALNLK